MYACLATLLVAIESTAQPDYVAGRQLLENKTTLFINVESSSARRVRMESVLAGTSYARINAITPATMDDKLSPAMSASITLKAREHMAVLLSHLEAIRAVAASALDGRDFAFVAEDDANSRSCTGVARGARRRRASSRSSKNSHRTTGGFCSCP